MKLIGRQCNSLTPSLRIPTVFAMASRQMVSFCAVLLRWTSGVPRLVRGLLAYVLLSPLCK
jgi:hypothetical protein